MRARPGMIPLTRTHLALAAGLALVVLLGVQQCRTVSLERKLTAAQLAPQQAATVTAAAKVETITVRLASAERVVTRYLTTVRTDTLTLRPQTAQDTATALTQLPVLAAVHDSLQVSCSAFVLSCAAFRSAAGERFAVDSVYARSLEATINGVRPGRLGAVWSKIKLPLLPVAFGLGLYLGSRVTR